MRIPILRLDARTLIVVIGTDLTDDSALEFQAHLTERVSRMQAQGVVIDVSALDLVDSFMAMVLNDTARMLQLLGAQVVVCGMQPAVAMTLVEMGRGLVHVDTTFTLESALRRLGDLMDQAQRPPADRTDGRRSSHV